MARTYLQPEVAERPADPFVNQRLRPSRAQGREPTIYQIVRDAQSTSFNTPNMPGTSEEADDLSRLQRCIQEIESATGLELSIAHFALDMTAAEMVKAIVSGKATAKAVGVQADLRPILFLLPGSLGYGPSMAAFAAGLGKIARVVPIKYPDLGSILAGNNTVASMADAAVEQIRRSQPVGHVRLLGHSLGGVVAFEVAARLLEARRSIKFLGILDTAIINEGRDYRETLARTLRRLRANRVNISRIACRALAKVTAAIGGEVPLTWMLHRYARGKFNATCFRIRLELQEVLRSRAFYQWLASPRPSLPIGATLFRCNRDGAPQSLGWDCSLASLDVIPVAGTHIELVVEPYLATNLPLVESAVVQTYTPAEFCKRKALS
ncbi:thioesterase domain-containing protein [Tardiphaga sp. 709]|uniref:thioesterase domain-containing protein n=1 Tax=Tardiphaga sp. 709 TaxID=3076039 RepID=UPI0028EBE08A|nr:thioesterase domain-containing protein [Tardiphaga sp. 709]WNV09462.1 thioesterase domain-containing protein [Tardiphaga sp. 709]